MWGLSCFHFLEYYWIQFVNILLKMLVSMSIRYCTKVSFLEISLFGFVTRSNTGLVQRVWKCFHLFYFDKSLKRIGMNSSQRFGRTHQWNCLVLDNLFIEGFLITDSISLLLICSLDFLFSSCFRLGRLNDFRNLSISSKSSNLLACNCS